MIATRNQLESVLLNVAQTMISKLDLAEVLPLILEQLAILIRYTNSSIMLREGDNLKLVA